MKKITIITALLLAGTIVSAQSDLIIWQKSYGGSDYDGASMIKQTADTGFVVAGYSWSDDGDVHNHHGWYSDGWIIKLNAFGDTMWTKSLGGSYYEYANSIIQTDDGGYIVALQTDSDDGDVSVNFGSYDYWIVKLDSSGSIEWEKSYGGTGSDKAQSIVQTVDGDYIVAGFSNSINGDVSGNIGGLDVWIIKLNNSGGLIWEKSLGGTDDDYALSMEPTSDDGYIIAGFTWSDDVDITNNQGYTDYWVVKIDSSGNIDWQKTLGGSYWDYCYEAIQTSEGGYIVAGLTSSDDGDISINNGYYDYWVVKLDSSGLMEWEKSLGGSDDDGAYSIVQTSEGGFIVAGYTASNDSDVTFNYGSEDCWIVKLNETGNIEWEQSLGGDSIDNAFSIIQLNDGSYAIAGYSNSINGDVTGNHGEVDFWLAKLKCMPPVTPEICIVTVDTTNGKNLIVWEKTPDVGIASYNIYRETTTADIYGLIGNVLYDSLSIFTDTASVPEQQSYRYKISAVDICGNESDTSAYHQTLHLSVTLGVPPDKYQLDWQDHYQGFIFYTYYIYRGLSPYNLQLINSISTSLTSYTDLDPIPDTVNYYRVAAVKPDTCDPTGTAKTQSGPYSQSLSNIDEAGVAPGIAEITSYNGELNIFPNPFTSKTTIEFSNPNNESYKLIITDVTGKVMKVVENIQTSKVEIEKGNLSSGFYLIELRGERIYRGRVVIE